MNSNTDSVGAFPWVAEQMACGYITPKDNFHGSNIPPNNKNLGK